MDQFMDIDEDDFEPTPLALPHQMTHRVVSNNIDDYPRGTTHAGRCSSSKGRVQTDSLMVGSIEHLISDSDGAGDDDDDDDDDDFHSANSDDAEPYIKPLPMDVIFGRGQPLRDHPGNIRMRDIIKRYTTEYRNANKQQKTSIIMQIQQAIAGNGARFLVPQNTQEPLEGCQPAAQAEIRGKISHGLRDAIKVEDLLDSEFVQLWVNEPPHIQNMSSPHLLHMPFQSVPTHNEGSPPPPLSLSPPPSLMMIHPSHGIPLNGQQFSYHQQHQLSQSARNAAVGPAIFHVSVAQGTANHLKDKTEDDDSTLETVEKGFSSIHQEMHIPTVDAVLATPRGQWWSSKYYRAILSVAILVIILLAVLLAVSYSNGDSALDTTSVSSAPSNSPSNGNTSFSTIDNIMTKGYLSCGVTNQVGYSARNSTSNIVEGFEVDLCRAIAAGIFGLERFGKEEPVEYIFVEAKDRFLALSNGKLDVLLAITTHTMERQLYEPTTKRGYSFSKPYLHNGVMFAGRPDYVQCADSSNVTSGICQGTKICVMDGTTHRSVLANVLPAASVVIAPTFAAYQQIFRDGGCNVLAGEQIDLLTGNEADILSGDFVLGSTVHSKEPIALVTRDDDLLFSDFCNWMLHALITAEEVRTSGASTSLSDLPTPTFFGDAFTYMFHDAVTLVGDYGQIYERHLEKYVPRSEANRINHGISPAMFAVPFGNLQPDVVPNVSGGKLEEVRDRGHLRCGISPGAFFAEFDGSTWTGLDVSFCQALSAAIFDGAIHVRYTVLSPTERFMALQDNHVDVLARVTTYTMERDVLEPSTSKGLSFSPPNFHDETHFAGIPPFHLCADKLNITSDECDNLLVCVTKDTTQSELLYKIMSPQYIVEASDTSDTVERFVNGQCNVIFGGFVEIAQDNIATMGYSGEYATGPTPYSRESLALVTTEDDVVWSSFVAWIVTATFFAEEQNITSSTFQKMPRVDLFQPLINDDMFRNAIRAVGSYAEIWELATSRQRLQRQGRNLLNSPPSLGPQLFSDLLWDKPISE